MVTNDEFEDIGELIILGIVFVIGLVVLFCSVVILLGIL